MRVVPDVMCNLAKFELHKEIRFEIVYLHEARLQVRLDRQAAM